MPPIPLPSKDFSQNFSFKKLSLNLNSTVTFFEFESNTMKFSNEKKKKSIQPSSPFSQNRPFPRRKLKNFPSSSKCEIFIVQKKDQAKGQ